MEETTFQKHRDAIGLKSLIRISVISVIQKGGGHWGLRYCGIGQFFMRYFGNFNLELRYCGILQTCGMRFVYVLVDDFRYKNVFFTFSDHF